MSRLYNQTGNLYSSITDCLYKTIKTEGLLAIYKGYFAHLARILPHTVGSLLSRTRFRVKFRMLTITLDPHLNVSGANE